MKVKMFMPRGKDVSMKIPAHDPVQMFIRPAEPLAMTLKEPVIYFLLATDAMDYIITDDDNYILI